MDVLIRELELPLDDGNAGALSRQRIDHLAAVSGVDCSALLTLARTFPSLRAVYRASEDELARVVGPVAAARISWFLDAPLQSGLVADPNAARPHVLSRAA